MAYKWLINRDDPKLITYEYWGEQKQKNPGKSPMFHHHFWIVSYFSMQIQPILIQVIQFLDRSQVLYAYVHTLRSFNGDYSWDPLQAAASRLRKLAEF